MDLVNKNRLDRKFRAKFQIKSLILMDRGFFMYNLAVAGEYYLVGQA
jgi:hypothetical protein